MTTRSRHWIAGEVAATWRLGMPIILASIAIQLMQTTDLMLLGWLSSRALAAAALGFNLYLPVYLFGVGLVSALAPMAARIIGADRRDAAQQIRMVMHQALISIGLICIPAWLLLWRAEALFLAMGQEPGLAADAAHYLHSLQWALAPMLIFYALRSVFAALGRTGPTLVAALTAVLVKGMSGYLLIFGAWGWPAMAPSGTGLSGAGLSGAGLSGAGLSTVLSGACMVLVLAGYALFDRRLRRLALLMQVPAFDRRAFAELWRLGLPFAALMTLEVSIFAISVELMGLFGEAAVAAHAIVLNLATLAFMVPLGLSQAATVRVGLAFGAASPAGMSRAGWAAFAATMVYALLSAMAMIAFPGILLRFYVDADAPANAATALLATDFLFIAALFQLFDAGQVVLSNMLRGVGDVRVPLLLALAGYWLVGMPAGLWLAFRTPIGPAGIWFGLALGLAAVSLLLLLRWRLREIRGFQPVAPAAIDPAGAGAISAGRKSLGSAE